MTSHIDFPPHLELFDSKPGTSVVHIKFVDEVTGMILTRNCFKHNVKKYARTTDIIKILNFASKIKLIEVTQKLS
jgi:cystathionine beta-lyase family protein involved in aluminum resistance